MVDLSFFIESLSYSNCLKSNLPEACPDMCDGRRMRRAGELSRPCAGTSLSLIKIIVIIKITVIIMIILIISINQHQSVVNSKEGFACALDL